MTELSRKRRWSLYLDLVTRGAGPQAISAAISELGVKPPNPSTISRWLGGKTQPSTPEAAAFARAYNRSPLEAFVVLGLLEFDEAERALSQAEIRTLAAIDRRASEAAVAAMRAETEATMLEIRQKIASIAESDPETAHKLLELLSDPSDRHLDAIAALDDEDIAGEQESHHYT